jgi:hypothetical protein
MQLSPMQRGLYEQDTPETRSGPTARRANHFHIPPPLRVHPFAQKYSASRLPQITGTTFAFHPARGAYRDRHGRWGGMRWTRERCARGCFAGRAVESGFVSKTSAQDEQRFNCPRQELAGHASAKPPWRRRVRGRRSRVVLTPVAGAKPAGGSCHRPTGRDKPSIHGRR